ncbi:MAG TPA: transcription-repair coupling factor [Bacteroidales bacterium]|nr:transcription-repair coupling factor [Bacteroidales bacterium]
MQLKELLSVYKNDAQLRQIAGLTDAADVQKIHLDGLSGSAKAFAIASVYAQSEKTQCVVMPDKESAAYLFNDLENILGEQDVKLFKKNVLFFPSSYKHPRNFDKIDNTSVLLRTEVLNKLRKDRKKLIVVTYPDALLEKVVSQGFFEKNTLRIKTGETLSIDFLREVMVEYHFEYADFVAEPGQYAVRGGIIDVYSFSNENPYRIELFGDQVDSIRTFDPASQLSMERIEHIKIVPDSNDIEFVRKKVDFPEYIGDSAAFWFEDAGFSLEQLNILYEIASKHCMDKVKDDGISPEAHELFSDSDTLKKQLLAFSVIEFGKHFFFGPAQMFTFKTQPQPSFNKNFDLLINKLSENTGNNIANFIFSDSKSQSERINTIIEDIRKSRKQDKEIDFTIINTSIHEGFVDQDQQICCYTDHQIFDRYHRFRLKDNYSAREAATLKDIYNLRPGDYITHIDHGVGRYAGLEKIEVNGKQQEAIKLVYDNQDLLYVSIHSLHRISKFVGKDGTPPTLNRLGSNAWNKLKAKTKDRVKDIAKDLIKLYAQRRASSGHSFSPDNYLQHELEASFIYQDTPDQVKSTADVKKDMEADFPMDRLICGDVGFGKTEVAIRAAFKSVCDSKQVAVLVPTTILAFQHFKTFTDRLAEFPCKVEYINRFRSAKKQKEVLKELVDGKVDILIGTHRLISKDVKYKDLGLLIIDEEQKFGVATKEKLRQLKVNVDTLTLTATPIPRTLQFSLMGARDLSIISTPPPNRYPIQTELHMFNEVSIRDAIMYEVTRGGQVFFVHNRIHNINDIAGLIQKLCPGIRTAVGHGQMDGSKLEQTMLDFIDGQFDVLVSTTIIESGLDIPNVNTIIINEAQNYGLSDLHQLRGRVGRTNKKAFCYLLAPPLSVLTDVARKRLKAIEEFSELGSGFNIAMRDLDIRGAGNILGSEQSGFISEIGFEMYQKILDEALFELKQKDFKDLYPEDQNVKQEYVRDCQIETDLEVLIPDSYVSNIAERLSLYKELDSITDEESLLVFQNMLIDRFGPVSVQTQELINTLRLRWIASKLGMEKIVLKESLLKAYFVSNPESSYYQSEVFTGIITFVKEHPHFCKLRESNNKLIIVISNINSVAEALGKISQINQIKQ